MSLPKHRYYIPFVSVAVSVAWPNPDYHFDPKYSGRRQKVKLIYG
jgi:hypothetical protein